MHAIVAVLFMAASDCCMRLRYLVMLPVLMFACLCVMQ